MNRVFADFYNADEQGRSRLNCIGTIEDLSRQHIELQNGQRITLYSEALEVDGVVEYPEVEKIWVAANTAWSESSDWEAIRSIEEVVTQGKI